MDVKVVFEDKDLVVLDKPAGMIVNKSDTTKGEKTVQEWVEEKFSIFNFQFSIDRESDFFKRAGIVHRLDKETSGIILVAKTREAFENLQSQFKERKVQKTYIALAHGKIEPVEGEINIAVGRLPWNRKRFGVLSGGRESVTRYRVISNSQQDLTLVELYPKSGRTHQIRVHLQYIKHPIFSDPLYGGRKTSRNDRELLPRVFLHASKISFFHPATKKALSFESPLPEDLNKFLDSLKP